MSSPSKKVGVCCFLVLIFSFFSFHSDLYWILSKHLKTGLSYVIDQLLIFSVAAVVSFIIERNMLNRKKIHMMIKSHFPSVATIIIVTIVVHHAILGFYFFGEEPTSILSSVTQNNDKLIQVLRGYHWSTYVLSFLIFGTKTIYYNIFILFLYILAAISVYIFSFYLLKRRLFAIVAVLLFVTSPSYLDMFSWPANTSGMSLALFTCMICLFYILRFIRRNVPIYYVLSLLFFIASLKISFARTAGFVTLPVFLILFPFFPGRKTLKSKLTLSLPFVAAWVMFVFLQFIVPSHVLDRFSFSLLGRTDWGGIGQISVKGGDSLHFQTFFPTLSVLIAYLFIPSQIANVVYPLIKSIPFIHDKFLSITLISGYALTLVLFFLSFLGYLLLKNKDPRVLIFLMLFIFVNIFYVPFLIQEYHSINLFDTLFVRTDPGSGPGLRYLFISSVGLSIFLAYLLSLFFQLVKARVAFFLSIVLVVIIFCNAFLVMSSHRNLLRGIPNQRILAEYIFKIVPIDNERKLLFSANPTPNSLEGKIGGVGWLNVFYGEQKISYSNDIHQVRELIQSNVFQPTKVYSFYTNPYTNVVTDISQLVRNELSPAKSNRPQIVLLLGSGKISSTMQPLDSRDSIFRRGVYSLNNLGIRFLLPRKIVVTVKSFVSREFRFPFFDVYNADQKLSFPQDAWDLLGYPPFRASDQDDAVESLEDIKKDDSGGILDRKIEALKILREREMISSSTELTVSSIEKGVDMISPKSLINYLSSSDSVTSPSRFFRAGTTPTDFNFDFLYPVSFSRVLLSVPHDNPNNEPVAVSLFSPKDSTTPITQYKTIVSSRESTHSSDYFAVPIPNLQMSSLRLRIEKTTRSPIMLNDIVLDSKSGGDLSEQSFADFKRIGFHYVESEEIMSEMKQVQELNSIGVLYACAEEKDWHSQEANENILLPGVWRATRAMFSQDMNKFSFTVDCFGSVLRKILFIGPAYPSDITVSSVTME